MAFRLADRLNAARRRQFVGRASELSLFSSTIAAPDLPFHVLHVFGPAGVGKTTLLGAFAAICDHRQTPVISIDGRNVEPAPDAFLGALRAALGLTLAESPVEALAARGGRTVLLVDTYEALRPIDGWLRDQLLPQLPEQTLVVLASQQAPGIAWRRDPGWQELIRTLPLRNLPPGESRAYLERRGVPLGQHEAILDFTHGHPLALSLVADTFAQRPDVRFRPETEPDVVKTLLEQLVQKVPGPAHRAALEACALVLLTTEKLLAELLGMPDAHELFEWLRDLSFVESGQSGLFPHDLAREALIADLRWRNPDWYAQLHRRARAYYAARLPEAVGQEQQRILIDFTFLHRDNSVVRPCFDLLWRGNNADEHGLHDDRLLVGEMRANDQPALIAMVRRHEGEASARIAAQSIARQPAGVLVFRNGTDQPEGFVSMLGLDRVHVDDLAGDPAVQAAAAYLDRHAPLRPGERAIIFRFWMARDTYQAISPIQGLAFVNMVRLYLTTPGLAFTFLPCSQPALWAPVFAYADLARLADADFEVGKKRYGMYGHDWRAVPPMAWLALLGEREVGAVGHSTSQSAAEPLVILSRTEFTQAVRNVLRALSQPQALQASPLLRSRLVAERAGAGAGSLERIAALQDLVRQGIETLRFPPREAKLYRALFNTFLHPAPTQEGAAGLLGLPFSTYRRHLKTGITRLEEILWQWEIRGPAI